MKQKRGNGIIFMALMVALVSLMIIVPVMAEADYAYWDTHHINRTTNSIVASPNPYGIIHIYTDTPTTNAPTLQELYNTYHADSGRPIYLTPAYGLRYATPGSGVTNLPGYTVTSDTYIVYSGASIGPSNGQTIKYFSEADDGKMFQGQIYLGVAFNADIYIDGPGYLYHHMPEPVIADFTMSPDQPWIAPLNITFSDASTGLKADTYVWELQSISGPYVYGYAQAMEEVTWRIDYAGTYQVNLTVTNGTQLNTKTETFTVYNPTDVAFDIQIIDDNIQFGQSTSAELIGGQTGNITGVRWYAIYPGQSSPQDFYEAGSTTKHLNYAFKNGNWMGWDDSTSSFSNNAGATLPNPVTITPEYSGEVLVGCYVFLSEDAWQNPTKMITVGGGQGLQTIKFTAQDAISGMLISPVQFNIQKLSDGTWQNLTETSSGQVTVTYPTGSSLSVEVIPPGGSEYSTSDEIYQVTNTGGVLQNHVIKMWKNASEDPEYTTANLLVKRGDNFLPIQGATIVLSDSQTCTTPASGTCQFTVTNDTQLSASITKTGFYSETVYFTPFGSSYFREFKLGPIVVSTTPISTTPTTTGGPGVTPTPGVTYPPGVPMPGTTITYPPGVPVIGAVGSETGNVSAREAAEKSLTDWMLYGSAFVGFIFLVMLVGFSGDALKKWSWIWK